MEKKVVEKTDLEKIDRILSTYKPVDNMPGYVWFDNDSVIKLALLREVYIEMFEKTPGAQLH